MLMKNQNYWNPWTETLERELLLEIELKNFRRYMWYAKEHYEFHACLKVWYFRFS